ncbi:MAG TPA: hypothetical protein VN030_09230, partial [Cellvibrio sp.]|nr:hypothetical protein [Cellvibrio sp.]
MSEWEILKIPKTNNKERILQALRSVLSNTNFVNDLKRVFICIDAYQAAIQKIGSSDSNVILAFPQAVTAIEDYNNKGEFPEHVEAFTPEELIAKFSEIYSNHNLRFNRFAWASLMVAFANHENWGFSSYMIPIVDFISSHPCLKSDVLEELNSSFKLSSLFEAEDWGEVIDENPAYGFAAALLQRGNLEFDIFIASLDFNNYTLETIDFLYARLRHSRYEFSMGRYPEAYNLLAEIPPELSPLVLVQRKLNILTAAVKTIDDPVVKDNILPGELDRALSLYPYDSHLLFLMADYVFSYEDQNRIVPQLIAILKLDPLNVKVFCLLGKQYLKEGLIFEANIIFQRLILLEPLN